MNRNPLKDKSNNYHAFAYRKRAVVSLNKLIDIFNKDGDMTPDPYSFLSTSTPQTRTTRRARDRKYKGHQIRKNVFKHPNINKINTSREVHQLNNVQLGISGTINLSKDNNNKTDILIDSPENKQIISEVQLNIDNSLDEVKSGSLYELKTFCTANYLARETNLPEKLVTTSYKMNTSHPVSIPNISILMKSVYLEKCSLDYILNNSEPVVDLTEFGDTKSSDIKTTEISIRTNSKEVIMSKDSYHEPDYVLTDFVDHTDDEESEYEATEEITNNAYSDPMDLLTHDKKFVMMTRKDYFRWKSYIKSSSSRSSN